MNFFNRIFDFKYEKGMGLLNMTDELFAFYLKKLYETYNRGILVVTPTLYDANKLYSKVSNYVPTLLFQEDELFFKKMVKSNELLSERLDVLNSLVSDGKQVVITDTTGYLKYLPSKSDYEDRKIKLKVGEALSYDEFISKLSNLGYERDAIVTRTGDMAVRGFIVDVFVINDENPIRIEFFGDEISSIRYFDATSQRSLVNVLEKDILPFNEEVSSSYCNILSYLDNPIVVFKDYEQINTSYLGMVNEFLEYGDMERNFSSLDDILYDDYLCYLDFDSVLTSIKVTSYVDFDSKEINKFGEDFSLINSYLKECTNFNKTVVICLSTINVNKFVSMLELPYVLTDENEIFDGKINIINKSICSGFTISNYVILSEYELFNRKVYAKGKQSTFKYSTRIRDLNKLEVGDYVVHITYGIGIYNGLKTLSKGGVLGDYLEILYDKGDKLYIPVSKIDLVSKYSGKDGYVPKINALNSSSWEKTKARVREKIKYEASRLLRVQAERKLRKGFTFSHDDENQILFESKFMYEETADQLRATSEIKADMESDAPMDRILCGDVGYGKTEVAFRAAFKAINDGKQVLYLCPTTLLSKQQYENALERFKDFPINIGLLNRFTSTREVKDILSKLEEGKIDFVIGTHRLLSNDIKPSKLGLLIIDEEQRFGVSHKEKLKEYKSNIDVLTLTATPIPRTLQMAMFGIKSLSLIETPPKNRKPIQTYVAPFDNSVIRNVIYKELSRNGQVFILYNRVSDIEEKARLISRLVPDASVVFAHGQMSKEELENRMEDFINGKYDILVCTTIIETGVDIPNVNSLIILDADRFGLAQLYQIRGRVGRSERTAYAYLMYEKSKILSENSVKRLKVIREFTELGSGFAIAARDLSIRGSGDILGSEQAGFIDSVGIDLYMKMLEVEINKLKGIEDNSLDEVFTNNIDINVNNHIKDSYVKEDELKIEIHKLINSVDSFAKLDEVKKTLEDRFGVIDEDMYIYLNQELFEKFAKNLGIFKVLHNNIYMEIVFTKDKSDTISFEDLFSESIKICNSFEFSYKDNMLSIKIFKNKVKNHPLIYFNMLLEKML